MISTSWTHETVAAVCARLAETLAALHRVDHVAVGLERFGRPDAYAERQLKRWTGQWELVGDPGLDDLAREVSRAAGRRPSRASEATAIVHGDFRIDNTLLDLDERDSARVAAVVDWELSTIGDPVADVATMCAYRNPAFDLIVGDAERLDELAPARPGPAGGRLRGCRRVPSRRPRPASGARELQDRRHRRGDRAPSPRRVR